MKFLSSIFSSETLRSVELPTHWKASIVLLVVLLLGAELTARTLMTPVGDHLWAYAPASSPGTFEWYRSLATTAQTPSVVAIGDSTGARNFDPEAFSSASQIGNAYSLARPGNFPLAMRSNTLPLLEVGEPPEIVLLFQWSGSFRDDPRVRQIERGSLSPVLEARRNGESLVTDYLYLSRLYPARQFLWRHWMRGEPIVEPEPFGSFSPLRRRDDAAPAVTDVATDPGEAIAFSEERRDVVRDLLRTARDRGFVVVAVVGPQARPDGDFVTERHLAWLGELEAQACNEFVVLDVRAMPTLESSEFKDRNHLFAEGAARFSEQLGALLGEVIPRAASRCARQAARPRQTPVPSG